MGLWTQRGAFSYFELPARQHIPMSTPCLKEFIAIVPICTQRMSLAAVLEIFSQDNCEPSTTTTRYTNSLVVVNEQLRPMGILHLSSLLPYLNLSKSASGGAIFKSAPEATFMTADFEPSLPPTFPGAAYGRSLGEVERQDAFDRPPVNKAYVTSRRPQIAPEFNLQQPILDLGLSIIEPLATLPADFTLKQFWPYLQDRRYKTAPSPDWALVDPTGKFVGLLDTQRLLQYLSNRLSPEILAESEPPQKPAAPRLPVDRIPSKSPATTTLEETLHPLIVLLERLPLPIMLQTGNGESVNQNLAWRKHFGALQDPESIRREAAELLAKAPPPGQDAKVEEWNHLFGEASNLFDFSVLPIATPAKNSDEPTTPHDRTLAPKLCHLGTNPNTCICICPMQNGSERAWQFIKIPLGNVLSSQDSQSTPQNTPEELLQVTKCYENFCLATLGANKDSSLVAPPIPILEQETLRLTHEAFGIQYEAVRAKQSGQNIDSQPTSQPEKGAEIFNSSPEAIGGDLWLVLAQDVTDEQQVAKELAAKNADLIQLNRLKDEFLACISHELKTPLTAVLGLSSLLKDRLLGDLNDRQIRYARLIHQSARHLMTVVNDILDLTRMETGQLDLTLAPVDIQNVCDRAYEQARHLVWGKNKEEEEERIALTPEPNFTLSIETSLESLIADELRLRQMLVNLLSNALKFTEPDGHFGLKVSRWEGWIAFTVWDTGIGIPEEKQHLIFQKFQQLENPLTRQFDGTGLGLVLTQRLARLHGGDVTFISKPGTGSEFTLLLPPSPPGNTYEFPTMSSEWEENSINQNSYFVQQNSYASYQKSEASSRLVLIVETTPRSIEELTNQLLGLGYRVVIARSGTEALEKARRLQPCAIFLNPLLPLLSGWDVLTLLKSSPQTQHIPVIVTATRAEKNYAYSKRANSFLTLPVQVDDLRQTLESLATHPQASEQGQASGTGLIVLRLSTRAPGDLPEDRNSAIATTNLSVEPAHQPASSTAIFNTSPAGGLEGEKVANSHQASSFPHPNLSKLLHQYNYRILEVDDLDQAELLARVWQPQVVLLESQIADPVPYLEQLSEHVALASLPLVVLDEATAKAALQVSGKHGKLPLQVFPCLTAPGSSLEPNTLLQAIQVAAGMSCKPSILVVDILTLPDLIPSFDPIQPTVTSGMESASSTSPEARHDRQLTNLDMAAATKKRTEKLQVLIQYFQTAGFKGVIGHSWEEVLRQVQHRSVDLLLIDLGELTTSNQLIKEISALKRFGQRPPTLVLAKQLNTDESLSGLEESLDFAWREIATRILPASLSMEELLEQIRQTLTPGVGRRASGVGEMGEEIS
ncbi:ATP-binding protein [Aerosakkonema funiforme]|uniref:ATP-binding response regulator n=1 Tax=Aerosakkonema funiforme TaxID=1246630 RepID=UPI0035B88D10